MNEIKCPKCGTVFQINETDYESIAKQIKDHEFEKELTQREEQYKKDKENAIKLAESNKDLEIQELKLPWAKLYRKEFVGRSSCVSIISSQNPLSFAARDNNSLS